MSENLTSSVSSTAVTIVHANVIPEETDDEEEDGEETSSAMLEPADFLTAAAITTAISPPRSTIKRVQLNLDINTSHNPPPLSPEDASDDDESSQNLNDIVLSDEDNGFDFTNFDPNNNSSTLNSSLLNLSSTSTTVDHQHPFVIQEVTSTTTSGANASTPLSSSNMASTTASSFIMTPSKSTNNKQSLATTPVIPSSASLFRYIRSWGLLRGGPQSTDDLPRGSSEDQQHQHDSDSSGEESSSSYAGSYDDSYIVEDDTHYVRLVREESIHWESLPVLPNRFCVSVTQQQPQPTQQTASVTAATKDPDEDEYNYLDVCDDKPIAAVTTPPPYLDPLLLQNAKDSLTVAEANEFVWEHATLLQAVLQLLAFRDAVGTEGNTDNPDNILKKGPLKKLSFAVGGRRPVVAGTWKVKYVELRTGNLSYYEDSARTNRKTIHLRSADTVVQESDFRTAPFVFELISQGSPTRYWMASSEKERTDWIRAIKTAMIGDDNEQMAQRAYELENLQAYQESLELYTMLRAQLGIADTPEAYVSAIKTTLKDVGSLQVPVQWVRKQIEQELSPLLLGTLKPPRFGSPQKLLKSSIAEFWKNMARTTFSINGITVPRNSQFASERIIGALTRCILEFDKALLASEGENEDDNDPLIPDYQLDGSVGYCLAEITELQSVSYARTILLSVLRSKERQDTASTVKYLMENPGVMVVERRNGDGSIIEEQVSLEVSFVGDDLPDEFLPDDETEELSAWMWTRVRRPAGTSIAASVSSTVSSSKWKPRYNYVVLSGTVLSYYEAADPRPHGLKGQFVLTSDATVKYEGEEIVTESSGMSGNDNSSGTKNKKTRYVVCISAPNRQDRLLSFDNKDDALVWKETIELAIQSVGSARHSDPPGVVTATIATPASLVTAAPKMLVRSAERAIKVAADGTIQGGIRVIRGAKDGGIRVIKGAKDGGIRVTKTATGLGAKVIRGAVGILRQNKNLDVSVSERSRRPSMHMLLNNTIVHGKQQPTVQCVVQTSQIFIVRDSNTTEYSATTDSSERYYEEEGWATVRAKLYQAFLMSGGTSGRIVRGNALVAMEFLDADGMTITGEALLEAESLDEDDESSVSRGSLEGVQQQQHNPLVIDTL
jgi:hypothetical protein